MGFYGGFFRSGLEVAHVTSIHIPSAQAAFYTQLQEGLGRVAWLRAQEEERQVGE